MKQSLISSVNGAVIAPINVVRISMWNSTTTLLNRCVQDYAWVNLFVPVWDSVGDSVEDSVGCSVWGSVRSSVWDSVRRFVWISAKSSVWDSVWGSVRNSVSNILNQKLK